MPVSGPAASCPTPAPQPQAFPLRRDRRCQPQQTFRFPLTQPYCSSGSETVSLYRSAPACADHHGEHLVKRFVGYFVYLFIALTVTTACTVNPVTGDRQLSFLSAEQELALGQQHYVPSQQAQGGRYVVDPDLTVYVNQVGQGLADVSDRPGLPYEFVVLNNVVPNAWALPGGKMAINRGLLVYLEEESQLAAVLGHEVVHAAARHSASQLTRNLMFAYGLRCEEY